MDFESMTKDQLEEFGRTVGIELDRRLNKAVLIDQLTEHLSSIEESDDEEFTHSIPYELDDTIEDPVFQDAEIEEEDFPIAGEDHPLMPAEMPAIAEEPVDPMIAIQEEADARRYMINTKESVIQAQQVYDTHKQRRIECEVLEVESAEALDAAKDVAVRAEESWRKISGNIAEEL